MKRLSGYLPTNEFSSIEQILTDCLSRVNSFASRFRQFDTISQVALNLNVQAVPSVMTTTDALRKKSDASASAALALSMNSSLVALAAAVWWLNEQNSCEPAPIRTHSSSLNGTADSSLRIELQTDTGLYNVPKGFTQTLNPISFIIFPMLSAKQLPSSMMLSSKLNFISLSAISTGVCNFSMPETLFRLRR